MSASKDGYFVNSIERIMDGVKSMYCWRHRTFHSENDLQADCEAYYGGKVDDVQGSKSQDSETV